MYIYSVAAVFTWYIENERKGFKELSGRMK